jgi:flagellar FliJ protein
LKRFSFTLDKVLNYKAQIERYLRNEHAQTVQAVIEKENQILILEQKHQKCAKEYDEMKKKTVMINQLRGVEDYLQSLRENIKIEEQNLLCLREAEEKKRQEVIVAKQDTASIDMLKAKRKQDYDSAVQKEEERLIEEFVSNSMSGKAIAG